MRTTTTRQMSRVGPTSRNWSLTSLKIKILFNAGDVLEESAIGDMGSQQGAAADEALAPRKNGAGDRDEVVTPVLRADAVLEVLRVNERLSRGILSDTVFGGLDSFLRVPGGYCGVPSLVRGLGGTVAYPLPSSEWFELWSGL
jgi:hypothetical protein